MGNFRGTGRSANEVSGTDGSPGWNVSRAAPLAWKELEWLKGLTSLPLVLKGVRTAEDAHVAVESGVEGILVSTQGGRQLDMTMGAIEMLPEVVEAANGRAEIYVDSGVRRGSDVLKALALGADAVGMSTVPEVLVGVHAGMQVLGISTITNEAVDQLDADLETSHEEVLETGRAVVPQLTKLLIGILERL